MNLGQPNTKSQSSLLDSLIINPFIRAKCLGDAIIGAMTEAFVRRMAGGWNRLVDYQRSCMARRTGSLKYFVHGSNLSSNNISR